MSGTELDYIKEAFNSNWISPLGPNVDAFEKELAETVGVKGAVALSSGTAAIHLALHLLDVGHEDYVICSSLTFAASANPILYQGAKPIFIDSDMESWNMSPQALERAFIDAVELGYLEKIKAVIVVNLYGQSADMDAIIKICSQYGKPIIEDAAESLGATYCTSNNGQLVSKASGTFGEFGIYSFNGNKIITTSGGGMLVSNNLEALDKARFWATQARDKALHYQHSEMGYNYRMSNVLAGIGRGQLKVLDDRVEARRRIFKRYEEALQGIDSIAFMPELSYGKSTRWLTALTFDASILNITVAELCRMLGEHNIEARPVWKPLHLQPLFKGTKYYSHEVNGMSVSDFLFENGVCLPSGSNMSSEQQERVIDTFKRSIQ
ncbi:pyridoxal phosphate-dependent aminotransferase [Desulfuribacillus stibiiarsenatis]|uniref:Pyridoxal phosphate-dependent aminotransferase n=1 Tax=Desulfuribacillus stibiiarsenatis TaxID=1390249 RepID=A0A1E5L5Z4_9FIRM|nr:pyridoxal phosphate-dependent aminotransferase [Desulfuribacillus stibiiarsenatis]